MHRRLAWAGTVAFIAIALAVGYTGVRVVRATDQDFCRVCQRPIHGHSKTVALVHGRRDVFCCPACALSEHHQTGTPVQVLTLTDFGTGRELAPEQAFLVRASDVNPCIRARTHVDENMHPIARQFDRCAPSLLAFASRADAQQFTAQHGGQIVRFGDLARSFSAAQP